MAGISKKLSVGLPTLGLADKSLFRPKMAMDRKVVVRMGNLLPAKGSAKKAGSK